MPLAEVFRRLAHAHRSVSPQARAVHSARTVVQNCIAGHPVLEGLEDAHFRARFVDVPAILADWFHPHRPIEGATVLDFGCGEGITALGVALGFSPARIVGVDIMPDPDRCLDVAKKNLSLESLPAELELHRVEPGSLHSASERFDLAYSWSVFEHVDQELLDRSLSLIHSALHPGGLFLVQIAPLYHSAEGAHLSHVIPEPWAHLLLQENRLEDRVRRATADVAEAEAWWSTYRTLNKITHQALLARMRNSGFEVLRTFTTTQDLVPPPELLDVFQADALLTNQVVVLARRAAA
jgi:2-polyprenyl-3-methyl-5-hydroxy-6-metoxy-1,4-benzoquinol methylase